MLLIANGFLPTRGSLVLDAVFLAMFVICAVMLASIFLVRYQQKYETHRRIQTGLAVFLAIAVAIFEIDVRFITDWRSLAESSQYYADGLVDRALWIHLMFAIPTPFVWAFVVVQALRKFPKQLAPNDHSRSHRFWGRVAVGLMLMTAVTGCIFYWLAFAC